MSLFRVSVVIACVLALPPVAAAGARLVARDEPLRAERALAGGVRILPPRAAPSRFNLVGLHWRGSGEVWFRTRAAGGGWSGWRPAMPEGEDLPDRGTGERRARRGWRLGNPYWTGPAERIQYRLTGRVTRLRAYFVWSAPRLVRRLTIAGTPSIIPRSSWGADESILRAKPWYAGQLAFVIVHHTAGGSPSTPEESAAIIRAIQAYHVEGNGWNDIGYNFLVDRYGQVFEGRGGGVDQPVVGAHAEGFNTGSVGIAVVGSYETAEISPQARAALEALIAWRLDVAHIDPITRMSRISAGNSRFPQGIPVALNTIAGHRDTGFTSCPGDVLYGQLGGIAQAAAAVDLPKLYEPQVSGALGGPVLFTARLSEALPWTVTVADSTGAVVGQGSGTGPEISWLWDAGAVPPGVYGYGIDAGSGVLPAVGTIGAAGGLDIMGLKAEPAVLTPRTDGTTGTTIDLSLTGPASLTAVLLDAAGSPVSTLIPEQSFPVGPVSFPWNGLLPDGTPVPDGRYRIAVLARSSTRQVSRSIELVVDRVLGGFTVSSPTVSPNGDGRLDVLKLVFDLARPASVRVRIMAGERSVARVFAGELAGGATQTLTWDGRKRTGRVRDGDYTVVVEATTELGTRTLVQPFSIDTAPPWVGLVAARIRRSATKILFTLNEPAKVKVWYDRNPFVIERPAGTAGFWQRLVPRRVRIVAWDAAGNASAPLVTRIPTRSG